MESERQPGRDPITRMNSAEQKAYASAIMWPPFRSWAKTPSWDWLRALPVAAFSYHCQVNLLCLIGSSLEGS